VNTKQKKRLRAIGHELKPVVTIAGNGLSENVQAELNRALDDHELIKVKIVGDREERSLVVEALSQIEATEVIQVIGGVALIYRPAREPNPALSNVARAKIL
jgi:RNA-binding protein